ncbi:unnamed protein product [Rotaria sordida]|uniref:Uncharacterized protein n=1 Tax=Rotaria sordida TaxID=392033 RepID=A0A819FRU8_9BILA|nr:unnamed protein product [Rotaria sordida]
MLSVFLLTINSLRFALPIVTLFGTAPTFFTFWFLLRSITFVFPPHIYRRCDDHLYSIYQRLVLFFFQNWVHVKGKSTKSI